MKKIINLFFILAFVAVGFTSCEKDEVSGGIPGMGDTPGELEIQEAFIAPDGITITGLEGIENVSTNPDQAQLKSSQFGFLRRGCGGSFNRNNNFIAWITVNLIFNNSNDGQRCVTLPGGLIFEVNRPGYQHGIMVSPVKICLDGHTQRTVSLYLMCINKDKGGSDADVKYTIKGVTGAKKILSLLSRLKDKKVNWQDYVDGLPSAQLKSANADDVEQYREIADAIQNDIWTITNDGVDLSEEQIEYIESIPMLVEQ